MSNFRRLRIVTAVAVVAWVALVADPAAAKGPLGATIEGPGVDAPIDRPELGELPVLTGLYGALWTDPAVPLLDAAPTTDLGPAWVITWDMGTDNGGPGHEGEAPDLVRQTVYPDAAGGPLVHTDAGQPFYAQESVGGWYEAPSALTSMLTTLGMPAADEVDAGERADLASSTRASARAPSDGSSTTWVAGAAAGVVVVGGAATLLRRRRRTT